MAEVSFTLNETPVVCPDDGCSLLEALRDRLGIASAKDGCSPQGQCGCCTVWVDGQPRVSCVTPIARVRGRSVTTVEGLDAQVAAQWSDALCATGGSQCGFCTPGIVMRLSAAKSLEPDAVNQSLLAHLCRCTGWQTIIEASQLVAAPTGDGVPGPGRDFAAAERRAELEGGVPQQVDPSVSLGRGGFADDNAPGDALVAVIDDDGQWVVAETLSDARRLANKVPGRRTTAPPEWPIALPDGDWVRTLQTTWVEPAYLEPDASWCVPGGTPASLLGNGGAFGGKLHSDLGVVARRLADEHDRPVRVLLAREDSVRLGPKRPPLGAGIRSDGSGLVRVARTAGVGEAIRSVAPLLIVEEVDIPGPPTSTAIRGAGWAEAAMLISSLGDIDEFVAPSGASARASIDPVDGSVRVRVSCGDPLDEVVLRSYCIGAAHMALGWVRSEALAMSADGVPLDLTMRSFGVLRSIDTPHIAIEILADTAPAVAGSDAVFAAVAAAAWRATGWATQLPIGSTSFVGIGRPVAAS
jgi:xanthine dehydrogenase small subunit